MFKKFYQAYKKRKEKKQDFKSLKLELFNLVFPEREELEHLVKAIGKKHMLRLGVQDKNIFLKFQKNTHNFAKYSYVASTFEGGFVVNIEDPLHKILRKLKNRA